MLVVPILIGLFALGAALTMVVAESYLHSLARPLFSLAKLSRPGLLGERVAPSYGKLGPVAKFLNSILNIAVR